MKFSKLTKPELETIIENANFTEQEEEIFYLLARGLISKEIAMRLCVSTRTVERRIFDIKEANDNIVKYDIKQKVKKLEGELNGKSFK